MRAITTLIILGIWTAASNLIAAVNTCEIGPEDECATINIAESSVKAEMCMARFSACGQHHLIIPALYVENLGLTPTQKYFLATALQSQFYQTGSESIRCEMMAEARRYYREFLSKIGANFMRSADFGHVKLEYIRNASKSLNQLKEVQGCLDVKPTKEQLEQESLNFSRRMMEEIFLFPENFDLVGDELDTVFTKLRNFISMSSDLSSGLALREVEVETNETHLIEIEASYNLALGGLKKDANGNITAGSPSRLLTEAGEINHAVYNTFIDHAATVETAFKTAIGGDAMLQYEVLRSEVERRSIDIYNDVFASYHAFSLLTSSSETGIAFNKAVTEIEDLANRPYPADLVTKAKNNLRQTFSPTRCLDEWYCNQ